MSATEGRWLFHVVLDCRGLQTEKVSGIGACHGFNEQLPRSPDRDA